MWLVRNADGVSTFCNDLIGDVAGTLSGAIGVAIVFKLNSTSLATTLMVALIAALTVGGKALGKTFAITNSTNILLITGRILYSLEPIGIKIDFTQGKRKR